MVCLRTLPAAKNSIESYDDNLVMNSKGCEMDLILDAVPAD